MVPAKYRILFSKCDTVRPYNSPVAIVNVTRLDRTLQCIVLFTISLMPPAFRMNFLPFRILATLASVSAERICKSGDWSVSSFTRIGMAPKFVKFLLVPNKNDISRSTANAPCYQTQYLYN